MSHPSTPVRTHAEFEIPFARELVWPVLSKTDWLNRSAGLPPVTYETEALPEGGSRVFATAKFCGLKFRWEEKPFEWREPEFYRIERCFEHGPIVRILGGMEFREEKGKTRMRTFAEIYPANAVGRLLAKLVLAPQATSGMGAVARHVAEFLQGQQKTLFPKLASTPLRESAFSAAAKAVAQSVERTSLEPLLPRLLALVRDSPDVELFRLRPLAVARQWNEDRWNVLRLFLIATRAGLLDLSWEVLCPNCRSTRAAQVDQLSKFSRRSHCDVCQITFDGEFDKSVELKFTLNAAIKKCDDSTFCLAGPGAKPHVLTQRIVPPSGTLPLALPPDRLAVRLRSPQVAGFLAGNELQSALRVNCNAGGFSVETGDKTENCLLTNPNHFPIVVQLERTAWSEDVLTAACVTNLQEFRDLFSEQVISPAEEVTVGQQIILFTDLRGSTAMYCGIGDAPAYVLVRDHFSILRAAVQEHQGAIVKTLGDAVMAVFTQPRDALEAVARMHRELRRMTAPLEQTPLQLKSSLHVGPCLAVNANDRLDYFGTTVNLAARLVSCCQGGDLALSEQFYRRPETEQFLTENKLTAEPLETQFRGFAAPAKVWRVGLR